MAKNYQIVGRGSPDNRGAAQAASITKRAEFIQMQVTLSGRESNASANESSILLAIKQLNGAAGTDPRISVSQHPFRLSSPGYFSKKVSKFGSSLSGKGPELPSHLASATFDVRAGIVDGQGVLEALGKIRGFVWALEKTVPEKVEVGLGGSFSLGIENPGQYRGEILAKLKGELQFLAGQLGVGARDFEVSGLGNAVQIAEDGTGHVRLFIPYSVTLSPGN